MKKRILATLATFVFSFLTPLSILVPRASAAAIGWDGGGADNNWTTAENWSGDALPVDGDSLTFDMSLLTQNEVLNNDITDLDVVGIHLTGTPSSYFSYTVTGNQITLSGDVTGDQTDGALYLTVDVVLGSNVEYSVAESRVFFGDFDDVYDLDLATYNLTMSSPFAECSMLVLYSAVSGSGDIISETGSSPINLRRNNGFTGDITVNGAGLDVYPDALLGWNTTVTMNGTSKITIVNANTADTPYDFNLVMNSSANPAIRTSPNSGFACSGGSPEEVFDTILSGSLTLMRDTIYDGWNDFIVEGTYTSNGHDFSVKSGSTGSLTTSEGTTETEASTVTIAESDKSTAFLSIGNQETVILNGERGSVSVGTGGILKGNGSASSIYVTNGGTLAPGESPGCLSVTGSGLSIHGTYEVEIAGDTVCSGYDQTDVEGPVTLGATSALEVSFLSNFIPALNDEFIIINNDDSDAIIGTFDGLDEGATFEVNGVTFSISYIGGDGNDVVLTATAVPATPVAGVPDTGIEQIIQNPFVSLIAVVLSAGVVVGIRKFRFNI